MNQTMFRQAALRRVASPDQLDKAVRVTLPRQWLALAALIVVVAAAVVWSTVSTVPTFISGPGYLLPRHGLDSLASSVSGTITRLSLRSGQIVHAGQNVGAVRTAAGRSVPLLAGVSGRVTEVDTAAGAFTSAGQRLALVEPTGQPMVVYAYVPVREAHGLPPGLPVRVTFHAGIGSAFGYVKGTVESVSRFGVSEGRLGFILHSNALIRSVQALGPVDEVVIKLAPAQTPSGWAWASGNGPPGAIPPGLSANVQFQLGSHHPIDNIL